MLGCSENYATSPKHSNYHTAVKPRFTFMGQCSRGRKARTQGINFVDIAKIGE